MNLSVGIVGLPNVGKSTLFNALLKKQQALAANYPFATIEPNVGIVPVPDGRLQVLAEITAAEIAGHKGIPDQVRNDTVVLPPIKPAIVEFVDIAGLVKGAAEGAGLGNKFLSHIREVGIIAHVVRVFEDENIIKEGAVNPKEDYETINMELMLADVQTLQKAAENRKADPTKIAAVKKALEGLNNSIPVRSQTFTEEEKEALREYFLLSSKPEIIVLNVSEGQYNPSSIEKIIKEYKEILRLPSVAQDDNCVVICAKIESDLSELSEDEQKEYLKGLGLESSGLERLIQKAYATLGLISFLTCGEKEVRAWTTKKGISAQLAAGEIHTDFIKKFIRAEVVSYEDFVQNNGWKGSREHGKARLEGKEYIMKDGDVVEFKIGS
jgi:GTP-binding protein YchF